MNRRVVVCLIGASRSSYRRRVVSIVKDTLLVDGLKEEQSVHRVSSMTRTIHHITRAQDRQIQRNKHTALNLTQTQIFKKSHPVDPVLIKRISNCGYRGQKDLMLTHTRQTAAVVSYRADVERQDEDDEEAEVPGQQRSQEDHPLLPPQISIALEEVEGQEENNYHHDSQRSATHLDE